MKYQSSESIRVVQQYESDLTVYLTRIIISKYSYGIRVTLQYELFYSIQSSYKSNLTI